MGVLAFANARGPANLLLAISANNIYDITWELLADFVRPTVRFMFFARPIGIKPKLRAIKWIKS